MSTSIKLAAQPRERAGKGAARATRRAGLVPAVIYGEKQPPVLIAIPPKELWVELKKDDFFTQLYDIAVEGGPSHHVLARDVQFDPVTDRPLHVDFQRVGLNTKVHVAVPVHFVNETASPGIKRGGVLNIVQHEIEVNCNADAIPHAITVDLTGTEIGQSIHIHQIELPAGVTPLVAGDFTIATIAAPTVAKAGGEAAATGEAATETAA